MEVQYSKQATKFLSKQDTTTKRRIVSAISLLPQGDVKKLQGEPYYRLRVGDFRVIFDISGHVLSIVKIGPRGEIYK